MVNGEAAADTFTITGTGGPANLTVDGGGPTAFNGGDNVDIFTGAAAVVGVTFGTDLSSGEVADNVAGNVHFLGTETLNLTGIGATALTVDGTDGNDAINQNGNAITVNNSAVVNFATYPSLTISGNSGDDVISVNPTPLVGVTTSFQVTGDDPTASDKLIVNGSVGADVIGYNALGAGIGSVTITGFSHDVLLSDYRSPHDQWPGWGRHCPHRNVAIRCRLRLHLTPGKRQ